MEKEKQFEFTVIMAVYNVEPFLKESILSLLSQDIGFEENVQLILVDDGSTDGSGKICDNFAACFPENIMVIHQENAGVSVARNAGLPHVKGEYVNFLDADDKFSTNALSEVKAFFDKHEDNVSLVSIPLMFFDARSGSHKLNKKYNKGTRLVDLTKEYEVIQMHISSSFIRVEAIQGLSFDTRLVYAEDAKLVLEILMQNPILGLVSEAKYFYRSRSEGELSALQKCELSPKWYLPCLKYFARDCFEISRSNYGKVLPFVQHCIMYDLQWRLLPMKKLEKVLTDEEINEYCRLFYSLLQDIDDEVIFAQKSIWQEHKAFLWKKKHGIYPEVCLNPEGNDYNLYLGNEKPYFNISRCMTVYEIFSFNKERDTITLEGFTTLIGVREDEEINVYLRINGKQDILCTSVPGRDISREVFGEVIMPGYSFVCNIENVSSYENSGIAITLITEVRGVKIVRSHNLRSWEHFPLGLEFKSAYAEKNGWMIQFGKEDHLIIRKVCPEAIDAREEMFLSEIGKDGEIGKKAVYRRRMAKFLKPFFRKEIWLISDRINKADDNGEALFTYVQDHKDIDAYYVISRDSVDYDRIKTIGKTVDYLSEEYILLFLIADCIISSAGDAYVMNPFGNERKYYRDIIAKKQQIFLQHGITKDDISAWINRYSKDFSMIVTAAIPEYESMLKGKYFYDENVVKLTGFPRHDKLVDNSKKQIVIMPTWRDSLDCYATGKSQYAKDGLKHYNDSIKKSDYFIYYNRLINNHRLIDTAIKNGYKLIFMPHPNIQPYENWFDHNDSVEFCGVDTKYGKVVSECCLVVTDYSSVAFDFAYLKKPVLYSQFDKKDIYKEHFYEKGYFDYERDGFGEVEYDLDSTVDRIIEYMENGCQLKEVYRERIEKFFGFHDKNNCQRTFEAILSLSQPESFTAWQTADEVQTTDTSMVLLQAAAKSKDNEALRTMTALPDITPPPRRDHLRYIFPAHLFKKGERVAIYAAGEVGTEFYRQAKKYGYVEPVMIVDRNAASMQATTDLPVQPVQALLNENEYDSVLIAIRFERIAGPVKKDLIAMGIPKEKIKWDGEVYLADDWEASSGREKTELKDRLKDRFTCNFAGRPVKITFNNCYITM